MEARNVNVVFTPGGHNIWDSRTILKILRFNHKTDNFFRIAEGLSTNRSCRSRPIIFLFGNGYVPVIKVDISINISLLCLT
jgi:hypothetical protein